MFAWMTMDTYAHNLKMEPSYMNHHSLLQLWQHAYVYTYVVEDIEELLISCVKERKALWDHTLPIAKRSRDIIATHWQEVSKELNGNLTPNAACKKWRYLKDSYMRIRNDVMNKKSGSAASKPIKWKWYEHMKFIHDTQDSYNAATNITCNNSDCASSSTSELEQDTAFIHKRRKSSANMLETLSSIMREPVKIEISSQAEKTVRAPEPTPTPAQSQDNITNMMMIIGNVLREFPNNEGFTFALNLLQQSSEKREQLHKKV